MRSAAGHQQPAGVLSSLEQTFLGAANLALGGPVPWTPEPLDASCPRCGRSVGPGEVSPDDHRCPGCRPERVRWDRFVRLGEYDGPLRDAVLQTKYGRWRRQGHLLGCMLGTRLREVLDERGADPEATLLTPVPMPAMRRFRRGIDHALTIARGASAESGVGLGRLLRRVDGPSQVSVAPSARPANLRGKIRPRLRVPAYVKTVVLIDDVRTTGATADACCRVLRGEPPRGRGRKATAETPAPVIIVAVAAAVSVDPGRRAFVSGSESVKTASQA